MPGAAPFHLTMFASIGNLEEKNQKIAFALDAIVLKYEGKKEKALEAWKKAEGLEQVFGFDMKRIEPFIKN